MENCLFCKIISKDVPSHVVYESEKALAFLDINPNNPGHTLVVPKQHSMNILDISKEDWREAAEAVRIITPAIKAALNADGVNIAMNNEAPAGQLVFHAHIHIIPRFKEDGFTHWHGTPYREGGAEEVAKKIKKQITTTNL